MACGAWPLYRFDPRLAAEGKNPLQLDSREPTISFKQYAYKENRYKMLAVSRPDEAERLLELAQHDVTSRWQLYKQMAAMKYNGGDGGNGDGGDGGEEKKPTDLPVKLPLGR